MSAPSVHSAAPTFSLFLSQRCHTCSYAQLRKKNKRQAGGVGGGGGVCVNKSVVVGWCVRHRNKSVLSSLSLADTKMLNVDVVLVVCASFVNVSGQKA